ncbi:MAG: rhodanese-like domain-containing protein [Flavobacteriales bacterium]|nr:rhodanese-like domain-containing protein [Flavobacteriales bacterium]
MKTIAALSMFLLLISAQACTKDSNPKGPIPNVQTGVVNKSADYEPKEFNKHLKDAGILIIDVRTPAEFESGYIEGAMNINWYDKTFAQDVNKLDKSKPVYIYCAVGGRSSQAKELLLKSGFVEVHNLIGGMGAWKETGLSIKKK